MNSIPAVTKNILIINVIIWLACYVFSRTQIDLVSILGLHYFQSDNFNVYQLVTYMFTHEAFYHMFFNMFALFMFGGTLEATWGPKRFLTYYMVTGIGAALIQMLVCYIRVVSLTQGLPADALSIVQNEGLEYLHRNMNYVDPGMRDLNSVVNSVTIGASGAVFGILLAFGMLYPNTPLYIMFIPIPIKAKYFVIGYGLIELFLGVANRSGDNVAHFAHLGGMIFGIFMILYWRRKDKKNGYFY